MEEDVRKIVCSGIMRKYYRFRFTRHYGGIATADCVGCNLKCRYCWSKNPRDAPHKYGRFYTPDEVVRRLIGMCIRRGALKMRISGGEPTLCKKHLLAVLERIPSQYLFILETNGTLIDREFAKKLAQFPNIHVRISLKGPTPEKFAAVTRRSPSLWYKQIDALRYLSEEGVSYHPAILMELLTSKEEVEFLVDTLEDVEKGLSARLELEPLIILPHIRQDIIEMVEEGLLAIPPIVSEIVGGSRRNV